MMPLRPLRTTGLEMGIVLKKANRTYRHETLMARSLMQERRETTPSGSQVRTPDAATGIAAQEPAAVSTEPQAGHPMAGVPIAAATGTRAQVPLNAVGFSAGPADGMGGVQIRHAIPRLDKFKRLAATGELDSATLTAPGSRCSNIFPQPLPGSVTFTRA